MIYVEGNAVITGNPGEATTPWNVSLITEGSIEITGNVNAQTNSAGPATDNLLFVAGGDIKVNGNSSQFLQGILAAHEQVDISGTPNLTGTIVAEDAINNSTYATENIISGNMNINYNGLSTPFNTGVVVVDSLSWQQIIQ